MRRKKMEENKKANHLLSEYGKEKLIMCADSFENIANSFVKEFVCEEDIEREEYLYLKKSWENRKLISNNMKDISNIMRSVAQEVFQYEPIAEKKYKQIAALMKLEKIEIRDICYITDKKGGVSIGIYMRSYKNGGVHIEDAAGYLSYILNLSLVSSPCNAYIITQEWDKFTFVQSSKYVVMSGIARAIKEGESLSGDNCSIFESERGKLNVILSDGMGSGTKACEDSEEVVDLMERLLETNYNMEAAMQMTNHILRIKHTSPNMSTLDTCEINLYSGECEIRKVGGACTFIKTVHGVEQIKGNTLPLGSDIDLTLDEHKVRLMDGDFILFFTDGAFEGIARDGELEAENVLADIVDKINLNNAKEIAQNILQYILYLSNGWIRDDITIIVVGIWEKT